MTIILFLLMLTVLIFVHELGHFLLAKKVGARVDEFAIGFPPRLFAFKKGETTYTLNLIPFGGYVKIFGENPDEEALAIEAGETVDPTKSLARKSKWAQAAVLSAGIIFNLIFAWLLLSTAFAIGFPASKDNIYKMPVSHPEVTVISVAAGSPAEKAGITAGSIIVGVRTGTTTLTSATSLTVDRVQQVIASSTSDVYISYVLRADENASGVDATVHTATTTPVTGIVADRRAIGISMDDVGTISLPPHKALFYGAKATVAMTVSTTKGIFSFFGRLFTGQTGLSEVSGPVGIAKMVGEARTFGLAYFLTLTALISVNLAIMNGLPIPALDGGRLFVVAVEAIIRRPLNARAVSIAHVTGFALLIILMIAITWSDIAKLW